MAYGDIIFNFDLSIEEYVGRERKRKRSRKTTRERENERDRKNKGCQ